MPTESTNKRKELEDRLIDFAGKIIEMQSSIESNRAGNHLYGQLIRSGTAPALLYAEAQGAESRKDFVHKISLALKELRESNVCLRLIERGKLAKNKKVVSDAIGESNELVSKFVKSVRTAQNKS